MKGHGASVQALVFAADGKTLASAGDDKVIKVWDAQQGKELATLKGHEASIRALVLSPDGRTLIAGSVDGVIKVWDLAQQKDAKTFKGHEGSVRALAVSAAGLLASGGDDGMVKLWDLKQGKEGLTLKHPAEVLSLAFSPSGQTLISGCQDSTVRMWDPATGKVRGTLTRHGSEVTALSVHPQGEYLLSGGSEGVLLRWPKPVSGLPQLPLLFRQDFRNQQIAGDSLKYLSAEAAKRCKVEAEGLRISLLGKNGTLQKSGIQTRFGVQGDFDATVSYELLQAEWPRKGPGVGVRLIVAANTPSRGELMLGRMNRLDGLGYACNLSARDAEGKQQIRSEGFATEVRSGKLRLVRQGAIVTCLVAEEGFDRFRKLCERELGKEDLMNVRVVADAGAADNPPLEIRIRDFEVRAEQVAKAAPVPAANRPVQGDPAIQPPVGVVPDVPRKTPPDPQAQPPSGGVKDGAGKTSPDESDTWLLILAIIGLVFAGAFFAWALWFRLRQGRAEAKSLAQPTGRAADSSERPKTRTEAVKTDRPVQRPGSAAISFACPDCGQKLKVKAEVGGKKIKCPQCSKPVLVPQGEA